ncbi:nucleotide pyrophosphohydrolase [Saccharomonospora azurea]|uniref:nucleotide pyrophosphohydrolase n=1 Tax=Saccharomonospora azurea TaxID=40988 RepID=UPI00332AB4F8
MEFADLQHRLRDFADERDWHRFHTPKNLAMALAGEAGELVEIFQWLTPEQSRAVMDDPRIAEQVRHELADVLAYLVRLADVLDVDLLSASADKLRVNEAKYPVELARGRADKYDRLRDECE